MDAGLSLGAILRVGDRQFSALLTPLPSLPNKLKLVLSTSLSSFGLSPSECIYVFNRPHIGVARCSVPLDEV